MRKAKIVATIGPASRSPRMLRQLVEAGMDVARLNFSHGRHEMHREIIRALRAISEEMEQPVAILQDLQGVKIRTGPHKDGRPVQLQAGQAFTITTEAVEGDAQRVSTSYKNLPKDVSVGDRVLLSDGQIELEVVATTDTSLKCRVISGGELAQKQGINLPGAIISAPPLSERDIEDLEFGIENGVDYVALSFVLQSDDILALKKVLADRNAEIPVIAKLEKPAAIDNLEDIVGACEGVMVARGDLGVEMSPEKVPMIQKQIIALANRQGKLVITATQMLDSMIRHPLPMDSGAPFQTIDSLALISASLPDFICPSALKPDLARNCDLAESSNDPRML